MASKQHEWISWVCCPAHSQIHGEFSTPAWPVLHYQHRVLNNENPHVDAHDSLTASTLDPAAGSVFEEPTWEKQPWLFMAQLYKVGWMHDFPHACIANRISCNKWVTTPRELKNKKVSAILGVQWWKGFAKKQTKTNSSLDSRGAKTTIPVASWSQ